MKTAIVGAQAEQLASTLPTGSVSWLYYSDRLVEFTLGIFGAALGTVILPKLSRQHAAAEGEGFAHTLDWGLRWSLLIGTPATVALALLSGPLLATLFMRGEFTAHDVEMTTRSLTTYGTGLVAYMLIKVLAPGATANAESLTRFHREAQIASQLDHPGIVRVILFGGQIDTRPITPTDPVKKVSPEQDSSTGRSLSGRRVARYLAKYVTKSLADLGISARRLSTEAIPDLDVSEHVRAILTTISDLADRGLSGVRRWLHTLGFRGHITSKSRRYSTTMTALRQHRATWTREQNAKNTAHQHNPVTQDGDGDELVAWEFDRAGHTSLGERTLTITAALHRIQQRRTACEALQNQRRDMQGEVPDG